MVFGYNENRNDCFMKKLGEKNMEQNEQLITDTGLVENRHIKRTRIFVSICVVISIALMILGVGAWVYH